MSKWITCGSFKTRRRLRVTLDFPREEDYQTQEEVEALAQEWRKEERYAFIWVEKVGA
jgi:hypothetical protein